MIACSGSPLNKRLWFFVLYFDCFFLIFSLFQFAFLYFRKSENIHNTLCCMRVLCMPKAKLTVFSQFIVALALLVNLLRFEISKMRCTLSIFRFLLCATFNPSWWTNINRVYVHCVKCFLLSKNDLFLSKNSLHRVCIWSNAAQHIQVTFHNSISNPVLIHAQDFST